MRYFTAIFSLVLGVAALLLSGLAVATQGDTGRVSVDSAGVQGDQSSQRVAISGAGRYVAFYSEATNLVPGDTNGKSDVFVHDRQTGETNRVEVRFSGGQADGWGGAPAISKDGRFVIFDSSSTNLVPSDTNGKDDIFVYDRQDSVTTRVSVDSSGVQGNHHSGGPVALSEDNRFVVFSSEASNLVPGDTNSEPDIFVHDRQTGATTRVSVATDGTQANDYCGRSAISADGRFVAFYSQASNLVADDNNGVPDIFVHDRQTGTTTRVSVSTGGGEANGDSDEPALSGDGRLVIFHSEADNLVPGDSNDRRDVFIHDRQTGTTERVSVNASGVQGNDQSDYADITPDGRYVAFHSRADNLVAGDINGRTDVFVRDLQTGETVQASVSSSGVQGNSESYEPSLSADGRYVAFDSTATNLVPDDTNATDDVFVHQTFAVGPAAPVPDIKANGSDGPLNILRNRPLQVTISLDPGGFAGEARDWWIVLKDPGGAWLSYTVSAGGWVPGIQRSYDGPLQVLTGLPVLDLPTGFPTRGTYRFYFAVDDNRDGIPNIDYLDSVRVNVW